MEVESRVARVRSVVQVILVVLWVMGPDQDPSLPVPMGRALAPSSFPRSFLALCLPSPPGLGLCSSALSFAPEGRVDSTSDSPHPLVLPSCFASCCCSALLPLPSPPGLGLLFHHNLVMVVESFLFFACCHLLAFSFQLALSLVMVVGLAVVVVPGLDLDPRIPE